MQAESLLGESSAQTINPGHSDVSLRGRVMFQELMVSDNIWNILDFLYNLTIMEDDKLLIYISDTGPYK